MKRILSAVMLLLLAALCSAAVAAAPVYKWVDASGNVHYSDHPPPQGARPVHLQAPPATAVAPEKKADGQAGRKAAAQKQANEHAQAVDRKAAEAHQQQCQQAREDLSRLTYARRVRKLTADGKTEYYTGAEVEQLRRNLQAKVAKYCE